MVRPDPRERRGRLLGTGVHLLRASLAVHRGHAHRAVDWHRWSAHGWDSRAGAGGPSADTRARRWVGGCRNRRHPRRHLLFSLLLSRSDVSLATPVVACNGALAALAFVAAGERLPVGVSVGLALMVLGLTTSPWLQAQNSSEPAVSRPCGRSCATLTASADRCQRQMLRSVF